MDDRVHEAALDYEGVHATIQRLAAWVTGGRFGDRFAAYALAGPDLLILASRVLRDGRVPRIIRGEIVAAAVYLASPIELIPEVLFGPFGLVDDAVVAARLFDVLLNRVEPDVVRELWPGDRAVLETLQAAAADARRVFAGGLRRGVRVLLRRGRDQLFGRLNDARIEASRLLGRPTGSAETPRA
jgi:uncharacterized membrane protein YkvA (DUF1232 family)